MTFSLLTAILFWVNLTTPVKNSYTFHPKINKDKILSVILKMSVIVFFSVHIVVKPTIWKHNATSEKKKLKGLFYIFVTLFLVM